jgi:hypothetical protein
MTYSFKEMQALCLELAERAEAVEASALRELALNYDKAETMQNNSGLGIFTLKVLIAALIFSASTVVTTIFCRDIVVDTFSGGPAFWARIEKSLDHFANSPDLPPEKKAKVIAALRKVNEKSRPYLDALLAKE